MHTASDDGGPAIEGGGRHRGDGFKKVQVPCQSDSDFTTSSGCTSSNSSRLQTPLLSARSQTEDEVWHWRQVWRWALRLGSSENRGSPTPADEEYDGGGWASSG